MKPEREQKLWPFGALAVICRRYDDPHRKEMLGSIERECWNCGNKVIVCQETINSIRLVNHKIICVHCAAAYVSGSNDDISSIRRNLPDLSRYRSGKEAEGF
jgi:hypothetical protein